MTAARTVDGRPLAAGYDVVLAHEHLLIDIRCWHDDTHAPTRDLRDAVVGPGTLERVRGNPFSCLDNLVLDDEAVAAEELAPLGERRRALVVDVTPANVGRDLAAIARIAARAGVDAVAGCGPYIRASRPGDRDDVPAEAYRDAILADLARPAPAPSVIGEIGTGDPMHPVERAALRGAAMAQRRTGALLYVHLDPWGGNAHEALDVVEAEGGDLSRTVLCHLDARIPDGLDLHRGVLRRGAVVAFDIWGDEYAYGHVRMPTDAERVAATAELLADGFGTRIVHSQDVCTKTQLRRFGGAGYDHLPRVVAPLLRAAGLSADEVGAQLATNALGLLAGR